MRVDAHQHFWVFDPAEYDWIADGMDGLRRDRLPADLKPLLDATDLDGTISVQARQTLEETRWLLERAERHDFIKGVVGWVDLCSNEVRAQIDRFVDHPCFCGVRHIVQSEPDDAFMLRDDFVRGVGLLGEHGLTYDILIYPRHLPAACKLVARFPDQPFVLDHIAKPLIKEGIISPWDEDIRKLAAYPNVMCKVSGLVTEANWEGWQPADFMPYLDVIFEAFGPGRIMFGSDWPVCLLAASYRRVYDLVAEYVGGLSMDEQAAVWGDNAVRFYGLEPV